MNESNGGKEYRSFSLLEFSCSPSNMLILGVYLLEMASELLFGMESIRTIRTSFDSKKFVAEKKFVTFGYRKKSDGKVMKGHLFEGFCEEDQPRMQWKRSIRMAARDQK